MLLISVFLYGVSSVVAAHLSVKQIERVRFPLSPHKGNNMNESRGTQVDTTACVDKIGNRFDLILVASKRSREISSRNRNSTRFEHTHAPVTALLEVQEGKIGREYLKKV